MRALIARLGARSVRCAHDATHAATGASRRIDRRRACAAALHRAAAALAVHPHSVVRAQVPVLRFQFARGARRALPEDAYVDALIADLDARCRRSGAARSRTVFIGGGTPSLFSAAAIDRLLSAMRARVPLAARRRDHAGGQSRHVRARRSSPASSRPASTGCRSASRASIDGTCRRSAASTTPTRRGAPSKRRSTIFGNVNLDLMYALPQQTLAEARARRRRGARVRAAAPVVLPPDARAEHAVSPLSAAAARRRHRGRHRGRRACDARATPATCTTKRRRTRKPGRECRHNLNYWRFGDYLGIGAGAHSKLSFSGPHRAPGALEAAAAVSASASRAATPLQEESTSSRDDIGFEFMLNALRLTDGVPATLFAERTGLPLSIGARGRSHARRDKGLLDRPIPRC